MILLAVLIAVLGTALVSFALSVIGPQMRRSEDADLLEALSSSSWDIEHAHKAARQAMNDAAGQVWRNPFE